MFTGHSETMSVPLSLIGIYFLLICGWYLCYRLKVALIATVLLLTLATCVGIIRYAVHKHVPPQHISRLLKDELATIEGILYKPPERLATRSQFDFSSRAYLFVETRWLEQGTFRYETRGKVRITLKIPYLPGIEPKRLAYGDVIRTRLRLRPPQNFSEFDYQEYLRRQGIYLLGELQNDRQLIKLADKQGHPVLAWIYALREAIIGNLENYAASQDEGSAQAIEVIQAMALGASREISPAVKDWFRNAGMYHLLVVSGIHIGILVWVLHSVLQFCQVPLQYRSLLLSVALGFYAILTGMYFPVLRAVIGALTVYYAITWNRTAEPLYSLAFSGGVLLFVFPSALFDLSFQLTFVATGFILLFYNFLKHFTWWPYIVKLPYLIQSVVMTVIMTVGATIGVTPLLLYYFRQFYPYTLLSNLLALPVVSLFLPCSLASSFLSLVVPAPLVAPLVWLTVWLAKGLLAIAALFPAAPTLLPRPTPVMVAIYYLTAFVVLQFPWRTMVFKRAGDVNQPESKFGEPGSNGDH